jgi:hypothetical protein
MITVNKIKDYFKDPKNKPLTAIEMRDKFGCIPLNQIGELKKHIVLCKDGLIRRR